MSVDVRGDVDCKINIDYYRKLVKRYIELHRYKSALFWADKVCTLSKWNQTDTYWLAQSMFLSNQYHRAAHLIKSRNLHETNMECAHLAAAALSEAKEYTEALELLQEISDDTVNMTRITTMSNTVLEPKSNGDNVTLLADNLMGSILYEQGKVYEAMDNRELATECYRHALQVDVHCFEAFHALIQHQMLSASEEIGLLNSLPFSAHSPTLTDQEFVRLLYDSQLNKYRATSTPSSSDTTLHQLMEGNLDLIASQAENHYYKCNYTACWKITQEVMSKDPFHMGCLPVHISCLVELKRSNDLFLLAHGLVDIHPENAVSWFAVGCYYYVIGNSDPARRYLGKAASLDKLFGPAWLAYGHSFARNGEHDQAMAAYFKASQLMKGCHLPLLYIGLENGRTNNTTLAEKFFLQAQAIAPCDPFVLHEMGVIAYQSGNYEVARKHFEDALDRIKDSEKTMVQTRWEPLLNNLGHVYRKLRIYDKAFECHMQAMVLQPENASTYSALGFCHVLLGQCKEAAELFHRALSLKRDDTFSTTMLTMVLDHLIDDYELYTEPECEFVQPKPKPFLGKNVLDFDFMIRSSDIYRQNILPLPALIPLEEDAEATGSESMMKTPARPDDTNDSTKLSFEVEMLDTSSQTFESSSKI